MLKSTQLSKGFFKKKALKNVDIDIAPGKIYGILGPNGSGKSTFMKIASGLMHQTSGTMTFEDQPIGTYSKSKIAYMPTEMFFYSFMTIKTVGDYFADFYDDFDLDAYQELIQFMNLDMNSKVSSLSTGMGAKLKIAATLSRNAKLIMLDEPLNGIDLVTREKIIQTIVKKANDDNTLLVSSHLVNEIESILDEVIFLKDGEVVVQGNAEAVREEHNKSIVDLYKEVFA
ncbi:ABC-2 type transport system ATP-binding protein [Natranaerovirga hydrolytica]|uniref:ABC-2 type transport system ATP-binding protein n=1 Tax=Natranaerovirga hydrolytica TaxID=680378 RepID=A0A4R1ML69_9FIRM|nr:ABC transporter ATP-binding protein [Natranaerovirga hydrolytica]TCK90563.1 ABC-2 type transport system ATP-binding protein [Natranaerovirga hydrolytica]